MAAIAQAIEAAQYEILVLDWWLSPELVCWSLVRCFVLAFVVYKTTKLMLGSKKR